MARAVWGAIAPYWGIVRLLPAVSAPLTLALAAGVALGALLPLGAIFAAGALIGSVPAAIVEGPNSPAGWVAAAALGAVGALFVLNRALGTVRATLAAALGRRLDDHLRERVMAALNGPAGIAHLEDPGIRDRIERALDLSGSRWRAGSTVGPLANAASAWLQSVGIALVLARFSVPLALAWFGACAVAVHFLRREFLRVAALGNDQAKAARRADYLRQLALAPAAAKELRLWGMLDWLDERHAAEVMRVLAPTWQERARGNQVHVLASLALGTVQFAVLVAVGLAAARGAIGLSDLAVYVSATLAIGVLSLPRSDSIPLAYGTAALPAVLALERHIAEREPCEACETRPGAPPPAGLPRVGIRFEGVRFCYPGRDEEVLRGLDLFIPAGRSLAIVGGNGAGKTTLVKLLARLYDPSTLPDPTLPPRVPDPAAPPGRADPIQLAGRITVDGIDLRDLDPGAWQRRVSAVFQDFVRYALPARDNVAFGAPERMDDHDAVVEAAGRAGALEMVERLPRGWDTVLSRQYRGGAELSGGQWQRLALARALFAVAAGAGVLILDEPTANLDVRAEAALYDRFLDLTRGLTTVLISHRFSTVRRADRIVVLEHGRIVEDGTHQALVAAGGRYATMFALQAQRFADQPAVAEGAAVE
jgi:ABC-type multidrug transport system fused ATPase/permease subunit